ncbi:MAG: nucleoside kinase [Oribacterium sp.]|nr:nucleoside kinase [Oribacterium sp.]
MNITANGITKAFHRESIWRDVANAFQQYYPLDILLVKDGSRFYELHKRCPDQDMKVEFVTAASRIGIMTYQRSAIFMMLRAFYNVCETVPGFEVIVDYTIGNGFYCFLKGSVEPTKELLQKVKDKMQEYQEQKIPILKRSVNTEDAIRFFGKVGMHSKEHLFRYRMTSRVNIYSMKNFSDYFYGYMTMDTGYIRWFDLIPYGEGFILLLPTEEHPDQLPEFKPSHKLYEVQQESSKWARTIGISNIGALNEMIVRGQTDNLILMQEAIFEKTVGNIATRIAHQKKRIVLIAGPSSSGKTTFSKRLSIQLQALGLHPHPITVDNYFKNRKDAPRDANGNYNFESIDCLDLKQFNDDMNALLKGERVPMPTYNFISGEREYNGKYMQLSDQDVLVIEGIHCLNDQMSYALPEESRFRIYISALTQINVDEHNRIPTTDGRLLRRMVRDNRTRGYSAQQTIAMWKNVRKGEDENIFPYQESADVMVNSSMIYELPVLKIYATPLLFQIPEDAPEYREAKRLLKFLDYVLPISPELIPSNSIVREFIGGSCLDVG